MRSPRSIRIAVCALTLILATPSWMAAGPQQATHAMANGGGMGHEPLFDGLGTFHWPVTTKSPMAQRYFDQGMMLMWAFNLHEAQRSFEEATELDPTCAMAQWGVAFSLGPHFNVPGLPDRTVAANAAAARASKLAGNASPVEKALVAAISKRYSDPPPGSPDEQKKLDTAYADAMREARKQFPDDVNVAALMCEAMMDLRPWELWTQDQKPQPGTEEIIATLEWILKRDPMHMGANHYYIHAVEPSEHPEKAVAAAERLRKINSVAGHLTHMPAHIWERLGRYDDSFEANRRAVVMDGKYDALAPPLQPESFFPMYAAHNAQFLSSTAMMQGRSADALRYARLSIKTMPAAMLYMFPGFDLFLSTTSLVHVRFGRWDDALAEPAPLKDLPYAAAMWHYTRGMARAGKGQLDMAAAELDSVNARERSLPPEAMEDLTSAHLLLTIAAKNLEAAIALKGGKTDDAMRLLTDAVAAEDQTHYSEPPDWLYPVRHYLGAALLKANRAAEAEAVYREDLRRNPENGWSLYGLAESLRRQRKDGEAAKVTDRFTKAWSHSDVQLSASGF